MSPQTATQVCQLFGESQRAHAVLSYWASQFDQRAPEDFCFPSEKYGQNGAPYRLDVAKPTGSFKEAWEGARKRAAIKCRFHDLRHTACTRLLEGGVPFSVLAQIMGWSASATVSMAKRYGHIGDASLRQAMALLDRPASVVQQPPGKPPSDLS
jgi:integrase